MGTAHPLSAPHPEVAAKRPSKGRAELSSILMDPSRLAVLAPQGEGCREKEGDRKFPWARIMQLGMGRLGLAPQAFWAMTLRELNAALGLSANAPGMTRGDLTSLLEFYPDE